MQVFPRPRLRASSGRTAETAKNGLGLLLVVVAVQAGVLVVLAVLTLSDRSLTKFSARDATAMLALMTLPVALVAGWQVRRLYSLLYHEAGEEQDRYRAFVVTANEWLWELDRNGIVMWSSPNVLDVIGYQPEEIVGLDSWSFVHPDDRSELLSALPEYVRAARGWSFVYRVRHKNGEYRWLRNNATPRLTSTGLIVGWRGSAVDITERVVAEAIEESKAESRRTKESRIRAVLDNPDTLKIVFQPIISLETAEVWGVEALSRFVTPPQRTPDVWFAEADEVGMGAELELLAIRKALQALPALSMEGYVSLNVSPKTLVEPELEDLVRHPDVPSSRLVLEVTEHAAIEDYEQLTEALGRLRPQGVRLAVDDAGAGNASLRHVLGLRPDIIKLDRTLTSGIHVDAIRRSLTVAMVLFADEIGAELIAEGVEKREEAVALTGCGAALGQGYLFGRPSPPPLPPIGYRPELSLLRQPA